MPTRTISNPDGEGRIRVTVFGPAPDEPATIEDPRTVEGTRRVDQVRVRYEEGDRAGTFGVVPRFDVQPPLD